MGANSRGAPAHETGERMMLGLNSATKPLAVPARSKPARAAAGDGPPEQQRRGCSQERANEQRASDSARPFFRLNPTHGGEETGADQQARNRPVHPAERHGQQQDQTVRQQERAEIEAAELQ